MNSSPSALTSKVKFLFSVLPILSWHAPQTNSDYRAASPKAVRQRTLFSCGERKYISSQLQWIASERKRDNMLQGRPKGCLAGHSAGKGCLSGICRGRKTQNQYSSRLCREGARFHSIAVPPYWFHSYIFEIVTIVVY